MTNKNPSPQPAPAPWTLTGETDGWMASHDGIGSSEYRAVKDAAGTVVALVVAQSDEHWAELDTETPGRLVAAAPELLEALRLMLRGTQADCGRISMPRDEAVRAAFAAIAKATGAQA